MQAAQAARTTRAAPDYAGYAGLRGLRRTITMRSQLYISFTKAPKKNVS